MRILFVGTSKTGGGTETHFTALAIALTKLGHDVAAVVRPDSPIEQAFTDTKVKLFPGVFRNSLDSRGIGAVTRAIKDFQPDWIAGSFSKEYWPLVYISKRRKVRLALFRHMATRMKRGTQYFVPRLADRFIVISNYMKDLFIQRGVPASLIRVLYNPLDTGWFQPDEGLRESTRGELGISIDQQLIGYIGALHPGKGIYVLLDAIEKTMQQNPHLHALWIGSGVDRERFENMLANTASPARHTYVGYVDDIRPYLNALDTLVLPSIEPDTFGRVLIEAQACGIPIIAARTGGLPETFVSGKTGILVEPNNTDQLAEAINSLCSRRDRDQFAVHARQFVHQNFEDTVIATQFIDLLDSERCV